jgi:hypothetical protein
MPGPDPLAALYLGLDDSPGDKVTLHALADWYEETGRPDLAAALRWTIRRGYFPFRYWRDAWPGVSREDWHDGWYWWANDGPEGRDWDHPASCRLPPAIWQRLRHTLNYSPSVCKEYPSLRTAYEALFHVWPIVAHLVEHGREARR